jgi:hypothetical protein
MIKGVITYLDGTTPTGITIGLGEEVKAPRDLAALEKAGWIIDDNISTAYKAWLAGKRQGDIPADSKFETWVDNVAEVDLKPSRKQIEAAVALGRMDADEAEKLLKFFEGDDTGEAVAPHDA